MNFLPNNIISNASIELPMFELAFTEVDYRGVIPVFIAKVKCDETGLGKNWQRLVNYIAFNFQSRITDEFSVWNLYIFFVTNQNIDSALKYKIENDTFSSRKIVVEENASQEEIIEQHITNRDINFSLDNLQMSAPLLHDAIIVKYITTATTNKRLTEDHRISLRNIIAELKELGKNEI
jgi:hypothetical protein